MANWLARAQATLGDQIGTRALPRPQPLSGAEAANDEAARRWQVCFPGIDPMEVIFAPEATRAEVATLYPGARLDALPDSQGLMPIPDEAAELPGPFDPHDDRRTCQRCTNLDRQQGRDGFRRCLAAQRGELPYVASRDYSPVLNVPKRCEGYLPRPDDSDRRTGRERWPELIADGERLRALPA